MSLPLLHAVGKIVQKLFVDKGWGADPNARPLGPWPVSTAKEAGEPDNVLTVYTTAGTDDGRSMIDGERFRHHAVQVRIRALNPRDGEAKGEFISHALDEDAYQETVAVDAAIYEVHCFANVGPLLPLGTEDSASKRSLYTINAKVSLRRLT